ncbi:MAG TPA: heme-binding domain-containing protein [Polyangiaceae bacterium]|nr:heme-binding domain-containing protein [Polyangiaceae bacterium]
MLRETFKLSLTALATLGLLIQLVPYGRDHSNPPVVQEPRWDRPLTRELAARACFDCHSNKTRWPWYSHVAPVSWLVQHDVDEGRRVVNFSEWGRPYEEAGESAETVVEGTMPPVTYLLTHPAGRLSTEEKAELVRGLNATLGSLGTNHD